MDVLGAYVVQESRVVDNGTEYLLVSENMEGRKKTLVIFVPYGSGALNKDCQVGLRSYGGAICV